MEPAREAGLLSDEHFTVDGTLIEAWANRRSFHAKKDPPKKGSGSEGRKLLRDTHESESDPEARLYKKSTAGEAQPSYLGQHGLIVGACVTESGARAEREAALAMLLPMRQREGRERKAVSLGADKAYQGEKFIAALRAMDVVPHIAEYEKEVGISKNWLTQSEREDPGFVLSQRKRKLVEKVFAWIKAVAGLRKTKLRKRRRVDWAFRLAAAACNLIRLAKLLRVPA